MAEDGGIEDVAPDNGYEFRRHSKFLSILILPGQLDLRRIKVSIAKSLIIAASIQSFLLPGRRR